MPESSELGVGELDDEEDSEGEEGSVSDESNGVPFQMNSDDDQSTSEGTLSDLEERMRDTTEEGLSMPKFLQMMKEEINEIERLSRCGNFRNTKFDLQELLNHAKEGRRSIKKEMAIATGHNRGQEWVSNNTGRAKSNKRFKGAKLGIHQFG